MPGAHVRSAAVIDSLAVVKRNALVGTHSKVCSGCEVPENAMVGDWMVVWGAGPMFGQRRRKRAVDVSKTVPTSTSTTTMTGSGVGAGITARTRGLSTSTLTATATATRPDVPSPKVVEDARLMVLQKEKEALVKMIGMSAGVSRKR